METTTQKRKKRIGKNYAFFSILLLINVSLSHGQGGLGANTPIGFDFNREAELIRQRYDVFTFKSSKRNVIPYDNIIVDNVKRRITYVLAENNQYISNLRHLVLNELEGGDNFHTDKKKGYKIFARFNNNDVELSNVLLSSKGQDKSFALLQTTDNHIIHVVKTPDNAAHEVKIARQRHSNWIRLGGYARPRVPKVEEKIDHLAMVTGVIDLEDLDLDPITYHDHYLFEDDFDKTDVRVERHRAVLAAHRNLHRVSSKDIDARAFAFGKDENGKIQLYRAQFGSSSGRFVPPRRVTDPGALDLNSIRKSAPEENTDPYIKFYDQYEKDGVRKMQEGVETARRASGLNIPEKTPPNLAELDRKEDDERILNFLEGLMEDGDADDLADGKDNMSTEEFKKRISDHRNKKFDDGEGGELNMRMRDVEVTIERKDGWNRGYDTKAPKNLPANLDAIKRKPRVIRTKALLSSDRVKKLKGGLKVAGLGAAAAGIPLFSSAASINEIVRVDLPNDDLTVFLGIDGQTVYLEVPGDLPFAPVVTLGDSTTTLDEIEIDNEETRRQFIIDQMIYNSVSDLEDHIYVQPPRLPHKHEGKISFPAGGKMPLKVKAKGFEAFTSVEYAAVRFFKYDEGFWHTLAQPLEYNEVMFIELPPKNISVKAYQCGNKCIILEPSIEAFIHSDGVFTYYIQYKKIGDPDEDESYHTIASFTSMTDFTSPLAWKNFPKGLGAVDIRAGVEGSQLKYYSKPEPISLSGAITDYFPDFTIRETSDGKVIIETVPHPEKGKTNRWDIYKLAGGPPNLSAPDESSDALKFEFRTEPGMYRIRGDWGNDGTINYDITRAFLCSPKPEKVDFTLERDNNMLYGIKLKWGQSIIDDPCDEKFDRKRRFVVHVPLAGFYQIYDCKDNPIPKEISIDAIAPGTIEVIVSQFDICPPGVITKKTFVLTKNDDETIIGSAHANAYFNKSQHTVSYPNIEGKPFTGSQMIAKVHQMDGKGNTIGDEPKYFLFEPDKDPLTQPRNTLNSNQTVEVIGKNGSTDRIRNRVGNNSSLTDKIGQPAKKIVLAPEQTFAIDTKSDVRFTFDCPNAIAYTQGTSLVIEALQYFTHEQKDDNGHVIPIVCHCEYAHSSEITETDINTVESFVSLNSSSNDNDIEYVERTISKRLDMDYYMEDIIVEFLELTNVKLFSDCQTGQVIALPGRTVNEKFEVIDGEFSYLWDVINPDTKQPYTTQSIPVQDGIKTYNVSITQSVSISQPELDHQWDNEVTVTGSYTHNGPLTVKKIDENPACANQANGSLTFLVSGGQPFIDKDGNLSYDCGDWEADGDDGAGGLKYKKDGLEEDVEHSMKVTDAYGCTVTAKRTLTPFDPIEMELAETKGCYNDPSVTQCFNVKGGQPGTKPYYAFTYEGSATEGTTISYIQEDEVTTVDVDDIYTIEKIVFEISEREIEEEREREVREQKLVNCKTTTTTYDRPWVTLGTVNKQVPQEFLVGPNQTITKSIDVSELVITSTTPNQVTISDEECELETTNQVETITVKETIPVGEEKVITEEIKNTITLNQYNTKVCFTGLKADKKFKLSVADGYCNVTKEFDIKAKEELKAEIKGDGCDGTLEAKASGGEPPHTFSWSHDLSQTTNIATDVSFGSYTVNVEDTFGCHASATKTIELPHIVINGDFEKGTCDFTANVSVTGGGNISVLWPDGQTGYTATKISTGQTHTASVTDDKSGCTIPVAISVPNCTDECPTDPNKITDTDPDGDGVLSCNEECPNDPNKTTPGTCGCGTPEVDSDGDSTPDCNDGCPDDPNLTSDIDSDGDGVLDCNDKCPKDPNLTDDSDADGDGVLNCNDNCPNDPKLTTDKDTDGDGVPDCNDNCPDDPNLTDDVDTDGDGTLDCNDSCPNDPNLTTAADSDGDGIPDCEDECPDHAHKTEPGTSCPQCDLFDIDVTGNGDIYCVHPCNVDVDGNGELDTTDYNVWRAIFYSQASVPDGLIVDINQDGQTDQFDYRAFLGTYQTLNGTSFTCDNISRKGSFANETPKQNIGPSMATDKTKNIGVYPNPVIQGEPLHLQRLPSGSAVHLYDGIGNLVQTIHLNDQNHDIQTTHLSPGIYIVNIVQKDVIEQYRFRVTVLKR